VRLINSRTVMDREYPQPAQAHCRDDQTHRARTHIFKRSQPHARVHASGPHTSSLIHLAPTSRAPLGILAPRFLYLSGFLRKSTNSMISALASSQPATSLNVTWEGVQKERGCLLTPLVHARVCSCNGMIQKGH
jgi:hypothetical protein